MTQTATVQHPDELLPWYVNETLGATEREQVHRHLEGCDRCQGELEFLRRMRQTLKGQSSQSPGELGLKRLQREIQRDHSSHAKSGSSWWRPALAAAVALIVVQSGVLVYQWDRADQYQPLSSARYDGPVLQVVFAPESTEAQIRAALYNGDLHVIGGPGASGVYRLRLGAEATQAAQIEAAIEHLRRYKTLVQHVEKE